MPRINYKDIMFDSQLEVDYYKHLEELQTSGEVVDFIYHPLTIPKLVGTRAYTPDFCVEYADRYEVIETKGWNAYSYRIDDQIHQYMKAKPEIWLANYCMTNWQKFKTTEFDIRKHCVYKKVKYLKAHGWVDYEWKNPNTLANQRKEKIVDLEKELKALKKEVDEFKRYVGYLDQTCKGKKLSKSQREWAKAYEKRYGYEVLNK